MQTEGTIAVADVLARIVTATANLTCRRVGRERCCNLLRSRKWGFSQSGIVPFAVPFACRVVFRGVSVGFGVTESTQPFKARLHSP